MTSFCGLPALEWIRDVVALPRQEVDATAGLRSLGGPAGGGLGHLGRHRPRRRPGGPARRPPPSSQSPLASGTGAACCTRGCTLSQPADICLSSFVAPAAVDRDSHDANIRLQCAITYRRDLYGVKIPSASGSSGAGNVLPAYLQALDRLAPRGLARRRPGLRSPPRDLAGAEAAAAGHAARRAARRSDRADGVDLVVILTAAGVAPGAHTRRPRRRPSCAGARSRWPRPGRGQRPVRARRGGRPVPPGRALRSSQPDFRRLWTLVRDGAIGTVHAARAHYGNPGSTWASWYHQDPAPPPWATSGSTT